MKKVSQNTASSHQNEYYFNKATDALVDAKTLHILPGCGYLFNNVTKLSDPNVKSQRLILCELGRLGDDKLIREMALKICEFKIPTKLAIKRLRDFRLSLDRGDELSLSNEIINTVNTYIEKHPGTDTDQIKNSIKIVLDQVEKSDHS